MTETILTFDRTSDAPRRARHQVREIVSPERADDATLLVSELITNAVRYGPEEQIRLIVSEDGARTRFTVHDLGLGPLPAMRAEDDPEPGGHGLRLVDELADRWGVERGSIPCERMPGRAPRWFELDR